MSTRPCLQRDLSHSYSNSLHARYSLCIVTHAPKAVLRCCACSLALCVGCWVVFRRGKKTCRVLNMSSLAMRASWPLSKLTYGVMGVVLCNGRHGAYVLCFTGCLLCWCRGTQTAWRSQARTCSKLHLGWLHSALTPCTRSNIPPPLLFSFIRKASESDSVLLAPCQPTVLFF